MGFQYSFSRHWAGRAHNSANIQQKNKISAGIPGRNQDIQLSVSASAGDRQREIDKCDADSINSDCPVCSLDYTKCVAGETDKLSGDLFYKSTARYQSEDELPNNVSKLMLLQRINVFGSIGKRRGREGRYPDLDKGEAWYTELFNRLNEAALEEVEERRFEWATRLVAWTYQWDNHIFNELRDACVSLIVDDRSDAVLITLCSNLCDDHEEWKRLLQSCTNVLWKREKAGRPARLRLLANLLIGHKDFIKLLQYNGMGFIYKLVDKLCELVSSKDVSTKERNNCLRILLYLLRIRCYDGKRFATAKYDEKRYTLISNLCSQKRWCYYWQNTTQQLLELLHLYLNGQGSLDGIVLMSQAMGGDSE